MRQSVGQAPAIECLKKALEIHEELGDAVSVAKDLGVLGELYERLAEGGQADMGHALALYRKALELVRDTGSREAEAAQYNNLGRVYLAQGDVANAKKSFELAVAAARESGDRSREANSLGNLGVLHTRIGMVQNSSDYLQAAVGYLEAALTIRRAIGDGAERAGLPPGHVLSPFLSNVYLHPIDTADALQPILRYADDIFLPRGSRQEAADALTQLDEALRSRGLLVNPAKRRIVHSPDLAALLEWTIE